MSTLNKRDMYLVSLGAAIGCNCIPCTVYHLRECKANGLTDEELADAIRTANAVKDVPRNNVTQTAFRQLKSVTESGAASAEGCSDNNNSCGCR
jgi:AhpD family alkylhydroperoxidase